MALNPTDIRVTTYVPTSSGGMQVGILGSGVVVHHIPSGVGVSCDSERSQHANKERALRLLENMIPTPADQFQEAINALWASAPQCVPTPVVADKVRMIKEVREKSGFGLKESKDAVDKMGTVEGALMYLTGSTGHCNRTWDDGGCLCGGDLPAIREGCYNWQK